MTFCLSLLFARPVFAEIKCSSKGEKVCNNYNLCISGDDRLLGYCSVFISSALKEDPVLNKAIIKNAYSLVQSKCKQGVADWCDEKDRISYLAAQSESLQAILPEIKLSSSALPECINGEKSLCSFLYSCVDPKKNDPSACLNYVSWSYRSAYQKDMAGIGKAVGKLRSECKRGRRDWCVAERQLATVRGLDLNALKRDGHFSSNRNTAQTQAHAQAKKAFVKNVCQYEMNEKIMVETRNLKKACAPLKAVAYYNWKCVNAPVQVSEACSDGKSRMDCHIKYRCK